MVKDDLWILNPVSHRVDTRNYSAIAVEFEDAEEHTERKEGTL